MTGLEIARVRPVIESEIERLISLLDLLEPDPDFEDGGDLEEVCEDEGAQCDDEGDLEQDTMHSDDEIIGWHSFTRSERGAINAVRAKLSELARRRPLGSEL